MPEAEKMKLNPLQTRTLALLQELANDPDVAAPTGTGGIAIAHMPHAHGDHVHVGRASVSARDASGLGNKAVWQVLERKGMIEVVEFPHRLILTAAGQKYETGLAERLAGPSDH